MKLGLQGRAWIGLCLVVLLAGPYDAWAQAESGAGADEVGLPLIQNFSPKDYGAATQNWAIVQDSRGVLFVGNNDGVLVFDGARWRLVRTTDGTLVRSLAIDENDRVYVGAVGELGYLEPDDSGDLRFVSMVDQLPAEQRDFADVWTTFATADGIYFSTFDWLARLDPETAQVWLPGSSFHLAFGVGGRIFIREEQRGLLELVDEELRLVPDGEQFAEERIYAMVPWAQEPGSVLLASRTQGLFVLEQDRIRRLPVTLEDQLVADQVYSGTTLPDGGFALGTLNGGVYLFDSEGRFQRRYDRESGLADDSVYSFHADREGGIWLGLSRGMARIDIGAPLSVFDELAGLRGTVRSVHRHRERLYAGTEQGLFVLEAGPSARFRHIGEIRTQAWDMVSVDESLLVAVIVGVFQVNPEATATQINDARAFSIIRSSTSPERVFVGLGDGLASLVRVGSTWKDEGPFDGVSGQVHTLLETSDGRIWLGTRNSGATRLTFPKQASEDSDRPVPEQIETFGVGDGLPSTNKVHVYEVAGEALFATTDGIYRFDETCTRFAPDPRFADLFGAEPRAVSRLYEGSDSRIWMFTSEESSRLKEAGVIESPSTPAREHPGQSFFSMLAPRHENTFEVSRAESAGNRTYFWNPQPLRDLYGAEVWDILVEDDGVVWVGSSEGLFRLDSTKPKNHNRPYQALVRRVRLAGSGTDLYGGNGPLEIPRIHYADNAVRFEYAAPYFSGGTPPLFQVYLQGNDDGWSAWTSETYREYTNLHEGRYRFRVRANNAYDTLSDEAVFVFYVLPPWYRTIWAYFAYLLSASLLAWGLVRWRVARVRLEKRALKAVVARKTAEIRANNKQLETLAAIVRSVNERSDFDDLLSAILRECRVIEGVDRGGALVRKPGTDLFVFRTATGWELDHLEVVQGVELHASEAEARYVEGADEVSDDIFLIRDVQGRAAESSFADLPPAEVFLVLRIRIREQVEGYLVFANVRDRYAFDGRNLELLEGLREYFVSAFQKALARIRLEDEVAKRTTELQAKNEQLETLTAIVKSVNERMELDELLEAMLSESRAISGVERAAALVRVDDTTHHFAVRATFNWQSENLGHIDLGEPFAVNLDRDGAAAVAEDIYLIFGEETWPPEAKRAGMEAPAAALVMRIRVDHQIEGYLLLANDKDPQAFERSDLDLLSGLKEHFVSAFQKARAHRIAERARSKAEEANRAKSDFLASMSHELRTPLNSILGFAQLMDRRASRDDEDRRHLRRILGSGEHLLRLINDVLSLSKIEAGHLRIDLQPFQPVDFLRSLEDVLRPVCESKGLDLRVVVEPGWPSVVLGDEGRLRQILLNLLGNAAKFTSEGGVTLAARWTDHRASFAVTDTGPGIDPAEQGLLFEAFSQTATGRTIREGTGLGLAVSRLLARAMGGDVTMVSIPGRGSTFTADVELAKAPRGVQAEPRHHRRVIGLAPKQTPPRILAVDDREDSRDLLAGLLRSAGFEVRTEPDGRGAVEAWREWQPDLIWMDQRMPGMDGAEATSEIRAAERSENRARVPILALSAGALEHERESLRAAGCDDFVPKPFREATVFAKIVEFLDVEYLYDESELDDSSDSFSNLQLLAQQLQDVPRPWLSDFERLLSLGEVQEASRLTKELEDEDLADSIRALLAAFQLDELEDALLDALGQTTSGTR